MTTFNLCWDELQVLKNLPAKRTEGALAHKILASYREVGLTNTAKVELNNEEIAILVSLIQNQIKENDSDLTFEAFAIREDLLHKIKTPQLFLGR